jgi:hypothetical protein
MLYFQLVANNTVVADVLIRYHIADKWEIYCPPLRYSGGITSHLRWGQSPNSRPSPTPCCSSSVIPSPPHNGLILIATSGELLRGFGKDSGGGYPGGGDGDDSGGRRERIELGDRSGVAGNAGIGVGVSAFSAFLTAGEPGFSRSTFDAQPLKGSAISQNLRYR